MIRFIIQGLLELKFSPILESKKRKNKESMICLMAKRIESFLVYRIQTKEKKINCK